MSERNLSLRVSASDAPVLQSLMTQAERLGKSVSEMFQELKDRDYPLSLKVNDEQVVVVMDEVSYTRLVNDAKRNEQENLRGLLLEGLQSEAISMEQADWDSMREEIKRRADNLPRS